MATSGAVTITAKVNADDAERRLQAIARSERELGIEVARSNQIQAQSASAAADSYDRLASSHKVFQQHVHASAGDVAKLGANLSILGVAAMEANEHVSLVGTGLKALSILRGPVGIIAALGGVALAAKAASDSMEYLNQVALPAAGKAEASFKSLQIVTEKTGNSIREATATVQHFDDALTSATSSQQAVRLFNSMEVSQKRQIELIDHIRDGLVAMGNEADANLPLMAKAIKQQNSELLDNMGVVSNIDQMYKNYAATLGTTADKLTQAQREEAVMQGVLQETAKYAGSAAAAMQTLEGKESALATENRKLAEDVGNLVLPFKKLGTDIEILGVKIERRLLDPLKEIRGYLGSQAVQTWTLLAGGQLDTEQSQGETDMVQKTIKRLQAKNEEMRGIYSQAGREGGYGPANIVDLNKFYEEKAKREQADADRAEREAKQRAEEQKRQAQQLQDDLATIGKTGRDLELAQEEIQHRKQLEIAQGSNRNLELEAERHRRALQVIDRKFPPIVMSGTNSDAAALSRLHVGTVGSLQLPTLEGRMGIGRLNLGLGRNLGSGYQTPMETWSASGGASLPSANLGSPGPEMWYASVKKATEAGIFDGAKAAASGDFGGLGQALTSIMEKAPDPMIQALVGPAGLAITFGTMIASSFTQAAERAQAYTRHLEDLDSGGKLTKEQQRARETEDDPERKRLIAERDSLRGRAALLDPMTGKDQIALLKREADERQKLIDGIDKHRQASWDATDAAERFASKMEEATSSMDDFWRKIGQGTSDFDTWQGKKGGAEDALTQYMVKSGKWTEEDVQRRSLGRSLDWMIGNDPNNPVFDASKLTIEQLTGINPKLLDPNNREVGSISRALGIPEAAGPGAYTDDKLLEAIKIAFGIKADQERVGLGSTPDRPLYSSIVNFKDMMAFFAPGELFRTQGRNTRRDDSPMRDRAVNTRAI